MATDMIMPMSYRYSAKAIAEMFPPKEAQLCFCSRCEKKRVLKGYIYRRPHCSHCFMLTKASIERAMNAPQHGGNRQSGDWNN